MSSTMRTRIWSAMTVGFVNLGGYCGGGEAADRPGFTGRSCARAGSLVALRAGRPTGAGARERARDDDLDDLRREHAPVVDGPAEGDAGRGDRGAVLTGL